MPGGKPHEPKGKLKNELCSACLFILGGNFIRISEEQEEKMSALDCARLLREFFTIPSANRLGTKEELKVVEDRLFPGAFALVIFSLERLKNTVEWADEFAEKYNDRSLTEPAETVKPLLVYLDETA